MLMVFSSVTLIAQDFQGVATYKTQRKLDIKLDSTQAGGMQDQIMAMLKKQFEKTYILTFNKEESLYKEDESLAPHLQEERWYLFRYGWFWGIV